MANQAIANQVGTLLGKGLTKGLRMAIHRYTPAMTAATNAYVAAADESRKFKRDAARELEQPLTDEEFSILDQDVDDAAEPRPIRICYQSIRGSRNALGKTGIDSPISLFSHWCLEIDGVYYELREHNPQKLSSETHKNRTILFQEVGQDSRKIKLEVSTNRVMHSTTKYDEVGTTKLTDDQIIWAASIIFARFGRGYDVWIDNCQHFTQLLTEAIVGKEERERIRKVFEKKSVMKLPVAASWAAGPVYGCTKLLNHALPEGEIKNGVDKFIEGMEEFYLHPRVFAARRRQTPSFLRDEFD